MAAGAGRAAASQALSLYRALLRTGRSFKSYNVREYVLRRSREGFRKNRELADEASMAAALEDGWKQLEVARRQVQVYALYAPSMKSIMDVQLKPFSAAQ